jgi:HEAT repeat protein
VESDPDAALAALEEAVRCSGPTVALARSRFALLAALRRPAAALEAAGEVRRLDPFDDAALYYRGAARARLGDHEGARADWIRALDRRPDSRRVALDLATLELGAGRARATLEILDRLAAADGATRSLEAARDLRRAAEITLVRAARTVADLAPFRASSEPETRRHLAFALRAHETAEAEAVLRGLLGDPEVAVRVTALRTYPGPWFRARVEEDAELGAAVVALLSRDDSPLVRAAAAALLKVVARPFAAEAIASRLVGPERDPDPYPRSAAAEALGRHDGPAARRTLVAALEDEDATVRRSTIDALFRIASTDHGFDPDSPPERRAESVARWRAWLGTEPNR